MTKSSSSVKSSTPIERKDASVHLKRVKEKIMSVWEVRVRDSVSSAPTKSAFVLRNQLPELLENLISNISPEANVKNLAQAGEIGREHGEQRAGLLDYTLSEMLHEYRILRSVIFEVLEQEKLQIADVRDIILNVLDKGIEKAIEQFAHIRSEELKRSNRDLEHFAAIAAHDLKSPLATIASYAELLDENLRGKVDTENSQYIQAIRRSSARMIQFIDRLLEYSSIGQEIKEYENVSINQVVKEVIENLKTDIEFSKVKIHFNPLPTVRGDNALLTHLFQNLISNGIKYRDPKKSSEINIEAKEQNNSYLFSIKDNGVGFDPIDKENIFSLFKRLKGSKTKVGLGIGLATSRKIVELHGGNIWADSQPDVGSTFFFTLPKSGIFSELH